MKIVYYTNTKKYKRGDVVNIDDRFAKKIGWMGKDPRINKKRLTRRHRAKQSHISKGIRIILDSRFVYEMKWFVIKVAIFTIIIIGLINYLNTLIK